MTAWKLMRKEKPNEGQIIEFVCNPLANSMVHTGEYAVDPDVGNRVICEDFFHGYRMADKIYAWRPRVIFTAADLAELEAQE